MPVARDGWRKIVNPAPKCSAFGHAEPLQAWALDQVQGFGAVFPDGGERGLGCHMTGFMILAPSKIRIPGRDPGPTPMPVARDGWRKIVNPAPKCSAFGHAEPLHAWTLDQVQGFGQFFPNSTEPSLG